MNANTECIITDAEIYFILGKYKISRNFEHENKVMVLSLNIFDSVIHNSTDFDNDRTLLKFSSLLHDIGYYISKKNHHMHSGYIIRNDELLQKLPNDFKQNLALICENHRKIPVFGLSNLDATSNNRITKLIAILKLSDCLSDPYINSIHIEPAKTSTFLSISFTSIPSNDFITKLDIKSSLFKSIFNASIKLDF